MTCAAVRFIELHGRHRLSVATLARDLGIHRTAAYRFFPDDDALQAALESWIADRIIASFEEAHELADAHWRLMRLFLDNPQMAASFAESSAGSGTIPRVLPDRERILAVFGALVERDGSVQDVDSEALCLSLVTTAIIAPSMFRGGLEPQEDVALTADRFAGVYRALIGSRETCAA